jgi:hypothetical protein
VLRDLQHHLQLHGGVLPVDALIDAPGIHLLSDHQARLGARHLRIRTQTEQVGTNLQDIVLGERDQRMRLQAFAVQEGSVAAIEVLDEVGGVAQKYLRMMTAHRLAGQADGRIELPAENRGRGFERILATGIRTLKREQDRHANHFSGYAAGIPALNTCSRDAPAERGVLHRAPLARRGYTTRARICAGVAVPVVPIC